MTVAERTQCASTTKKGARCKLYALPNEKVCHVHIKYQNTKTKNAEIPKTNQTKRKGQKDESNIKNFVYQKFSFKNDVVDSKPGNIYVFTYAHMMHSTPTEKSYLHLAAPTSYKGIDYSDTKPFDTSDKILIKVGYTRKSPELRVNEWREQCGHSDFILLYPGCLVPTYDKKKKQKITVLSKLMSKLSLDSANRIRDDHLTKLHTGRKYTGLNSTQTCFVSKNPYQVEQAIHRILRNKYGFGKMYCEGCSRHKIDGNQNMTKILGIHTEWFLVPRNEMSFIWDIINEQCIH